jgi:hypothetical protein
MIKTDLPEMESKEEIERHDSLGKQMLEKRTRRDGK